HRRTGSRWRLGLNRWCQGSLGDCAAEAIADTADGLEQRWRRWGLADGLPYPAHTARERLVIDIRLWPAVLQQLAAGHQTVAVLQQIPQDRAHFPLEGHHLAGTIQGVLVGIQDTVSKAIDHTRLPRWPAGQRPDMTMVAYGDRPSTDRQ